MQDCGLWVYFSCELAVMEWRKREGKIFDVHVRRAREDDEATMRIDDVAKSACMQ